MLDLLIDLYGEADGRATWARLQRLLDRYRPRLRGRSQPGARPRSLGLSERDAILITYADQVVEPGVAPLHTLAGLAARYLDGAISTIHILPFYPYSSDDGFSVIDYTAVDPALGTWDDVARLGERFRLMFDAVLNHASVKSEWFRAFLRGEPRYRDHFIAVAQGSDLSQVVRPRALPLLTRFEAASGERWIWTTFSADQADLNYRQPQVLLDMVEVLLFYVERGASLIRLDAIPYLWKEIGTPCIHLPQTHTVVRLLRAVLDDVAPHVLLVAEANVPHAENVSYFGDGTSEAQLVYNFALPPLLLHTLQTGSAAALTQWAAGLALPSDRVAWLNFAASHDGIGLMPAQGILSDAEIEALIAHAVAHGGLVSYRRHAGGRESPYELNINYFDALADPQGTLPLGVQVDRFIVSQAIMLALAGVPGIYFHSLFGSRGWPEGVRLTGRPRTINRQKLALAALERELVDPASLRHQVFARYRALLAARTACRAFHPLGAQRVLRLGDAVFALLRTAPDGGESALCLHNISGQPVQLALDRRALGLGAYATDLLTGERVAMGEPAIASLAPYEVRWLRI